MALELVTELMINNVLTTWVPTDILKNAVYSFQAGSINQSPTVATGCDNSALTFTTGNSQAFNLDLGNGLNFWKLSNAVQRHLDLNQSEIYTQQGYTGSQSRTDNIIFMIDDSVEEAYMIEVYGYYDSGWARWYTNFSYYPLNVSQHETKNTLYNWIKGQAPVSYNWQSVPSISGKNGILSLPVLIDTDGNPVSSGSTSDFSAIPSEAKVRTLANANI